MQHRSLPSWQGYPVGVQVEKEETMAEILAEFPRTARVRQSMYPWATWLDGRVHGLKQGEDYCTSTISMQAQVGSAAKRYGVRYRTTKTDYGLALQAILDWNADSDTDGSL
jgi:hypothetical protein